MHHAMKRAKHPEPGTDRVGIAESIEEHVILKVAQCIADSSTLIAFLEAVRPLNVLGPLDHLYQLSFRMDHTDLWPSLTVRNVSPFFLGHLGPIMKFYTHVTIDSNQVDLLWLQRHLHPLADLIWTAELCPPKGCLTPVQDWYNQLATLPITTILAHRTYVFDQFLTLLPKMTRLTGLDFIWVLCCDEASVPDGPTGAVESKANRLCRAIIAWLRSNPVRLLDVQHFKSNSPHLSPSLLVELISAIFTCPTLESLSFQYSDLANIAATSLSTSLKALTVFQCASAEAYVTSLAAHLPSSNVESVTYHLHLGGRGGGFEGLKSVLDVLPVSKTIRALELGGRHSHHVTSQREWLRLLPLLIPTSVKTLTLRDIALSRVCLQELVHVIAENDTIDVVNLLELGISFPDLRKLIELTADQDRPVRMRSIDIGVSKIKPTGLTKLAALAAKSNTEFRYKVY